MGQVFLNTALINVAPRFQKAIWKEKRIDRVYNSVKEMSKYYNVRNCNYDIANDDGNIIRRVRNGHINSFGDRY